MTPLELVTSRLLAAGLNVESHTGMAQCPAHEDRNPSLSVTEGTDGRVLLFCIAGCRTGEIVAALGLRMRDLFPGRARQPRGRVTPRLVPVAGGGQATRAERDLIEADLARRVRAWADHYDAGG